MNESRFLPPAYDYNLETFAITAEAPSNIAIVKYWGKRQGQLPANPSLSFTLSEAKTLTSVTFRQIKKTAGFSFDINFEGRPEPSFRPKISQFLERVFAYVPFLENYHLQIDTRNTFPHSSGIASSASGMAALALCLTEFERVLRKLTADDFFWEKTAFLARLGSGSATRSLQGPVVLWGETDADAKANALFGTTPTFEIHSEFNQTHDSILLVETGQKQVSSTVGHNLMHGHPYANNRFEQARKHLVALKTALQSGDWEHFIKITESEALSLHAMMMTSNPYFILMQPQTLEIIKKIWSYRAESKLPLCFTLDAGANVHLLYPASAAKPVRTFIDSALLEHCQNRQCLFDSLGKGAKINTKVNNL